MGHTKSINLIYWIWNYKYIIPCLWIFRDIITKEYYFLYTAINVQQYYCTLIQIIFGKSVNYIFRHASIIRVPLITFLIFAQIWKIIIQIKRDLFLLFQPIHSTNKNVSILKKFYVYWWDQAIDLIFHNPQNFFIHAHIILNRIW